MRLGKQSPNRFLLALGQSIINFVNNTELNYKNTSSTGSGATGKVPFFKGWIVLTGGRAWLSIINSWASCVNWCLMSGTSSMSPDNIGSLFETITLRNRWGRRKSYVIRSALGNQQFEREMIKREIIKMTLKDPLISKGFQFSVRVYEERILSEQGSNSGLRRKISTLLLSITTIS